MAGAITPTAGTPFNVPGYISAASMTGTSVVSGPWVNVAGLTSVAFQASWTGTPTGTLAINVSQDAAPANVIVLGATSLTITGVTNPAGSAGSFVFYLSGLSTPWVQLTYTNASSTGTLNVGVSGK